MIYFAEVFASSYGGGYAIDTDPAVALRRARSYIAETSRSEKGSYVLEFEDDANLDLGDGLNGGWRASKSPVRVVRRNKLKNYTDDQLMGKK